MSADRGPGQSDRLDRWLTYAIPAVSFGGLALALGLQVAGVIRDAADFWYGAFIGSLLLGYLAYRKPRKDIVSLCAPIFGFLIFIAPLENSPSLLIQFLFAASICILLIRLNRKFVDEPATKGVEDPMDQYLDEYIERMRPMYTGVSGRAAHEVASVFFSFKYGIYENAITEAEEAISLLGEDEAERVLKKAIRIVQERAANLRDSNVSKVTDLVFSGEESPFIAIVLPEEGTGEHETLQLHNALILLYAVAYLRSPDDEQALEEHRKYVTGILSDYKREMGL